jgi:hypothetical protein
MILDFNDARPLSDMNSRMTKRQFLRATAAATVLGSVWEPVRALAREADPIRWRLNRNRNRNWPLIAKGQALCGSNYS